MSTIEIVSCGFKWHKLTAKFSPEEMPRLGAEHLRLAGAKVRCEPQGATAEFKLNIADAAQVRKMLALLLAFGQDGDFAARKKIMLEPNSEPENVIVRQQQRLAGTIANWQDGWQTAVSHCLRQKFSRVETLRYIRQQFGAVEESAIREQVAEALRHRYQSMIFCQTFMRRLGWQTHAASENQSAPSESATAQKTGVA